MRTPAFVFAVLLAGLPAEVAAQPVALGGEILVNSYTTGDQTEPTVASDGAGNFIVVWSGSPPPVGEGAIRGQRYDSSGAAQGTEFQVSDAGVSASSPSVAMAPDGSFIVAWLESEPKIAARAFDGSGVPQGTAFRVDTTIFDYAHGYPQAYQDIKEAPEVASNQNGEFTVVWTGGYTSYLYFTHHRRTVFGQQVDGSGALLGTEFKVGSNSYYFSDAPHVAADGAGEFVVVWTEITSYTYYQSGSQYLRSANFEVRARRFDDGGVPTVDVFEVGEDGRFGPRVGVEPGGQFIVAWANTDTPDGSQVFARRYDETATELGTEFLVSTPPSSVGGQVNAGAVGVDVALEADGRSLVTWTSGGAGFEGNTDGSSNGLFAQSFASIGAPLGTEIAVNTYATGAQTRPVVARTDVGTFVVAWNSEGQDVAGFAAVARQFGQGTCACGACQIGGCPAEPCSDCLSPAIATFLIKNDPAVGSPNDSIKWKWRKGEAFDQDALGNPTTETPYTLCVYDSVAGSAALATVLSVPPGSLWTDKDPGGVRYTDMTGASGGVMRIRLKTGAAGKTKVLLTAKGSNVPTPAPADPEYFAQDPNVVVQLHTHGGTCWTSEFAAAGTLANDPTRFKAEAP
jgi:hypothetical protein